MDALNPAPAARAKGPRLPSNRIPLPLWMREFAQIRAAAVTFAVTAALAIAGVTATHWQLADARRAEQQALAARDTARQSFLHVESEKQEIRTYQPLFTTLRQRGFVGAENRLEWVEAIRQIQEQRHLLPLTYDILPQQPYKVEGRLATGEYQLRGSRMALHMDMLHELDLFYLLSDLRQRGVFTVQDCTVQRPASAGNASNAAVAANLTADCTLNWLTLTPGARRPGGAR